MQVLNESNNNLSAYSNNGMHSFAESYVNLVQDIQAGSSMNMFRNPIDVVTDRLAKETLKEYFVNESYDPMDPEFKSPEAVKAHIAACEQLFEHDCKAMLSEFTNPQSIAPMIGMALPMHKFILMNMVFDKGAIPKFVAPSPKFTISTEYRILVDTQGNELDFFRDQSKIADAIENTAPLKYIDFTLPVHKDTEIVHTYMGGLAHADHLSIETSLYALKLPGVLVKKGEILPDEDGYRRRNGQVATEDTVCDIWQPLDYNFEPQYGHGQEQRSFNRRVRISYNTADGVTTIDEIFTGVLANDRIELYCSSGKAYDVRLKSRLDTSNARATTCQVRWKEDERIVEIPNAIPMNTTISPEEVRDISALYNINQVTKLMALTKTAMAEHKDKSILGKLNASWERMDETNSAYGSFDFSPRIDYAHDHVEYRYKAFFDFFQSFVQTLLQKYNDPNVTISVFGDPDTVAKITPDSQMITYSAPENIGPVEIDYTKTVVVNSRKQVYTFIGSDKLRGSKEFIVVVNPKGTDKIMYRIYDYQLYISNEIRNADNPSLPSFHSFERWTFTEHMPVQGRVQLLNVSGINKDRYDFMPVKLVTD